MNAAPALELNLEQRTDEWHAFRKGKIGSSMAAGCLGRGKYFPRTPLEVVRAMRGESEDVSDSYIVQHGNRFEPAAREAVEEALDLVLLPKVLQHPELPWMVASLDGIDLFGGVLVELKCPPVSPHKKAGKADVKDAERFILAQDGKMSDFDRDQVDHQLMVAHAVHGTTQAVFCVWHDDRLATVVVERDPQREQVLFEAERFCVGHFEAGTLPEPTERDVIVRDDAGWKQLAEDYQRTAVALKELEARQDGIRKALIAQAGDHPVTEGGGVRVTRYWRAGSVDYGRLIEEHGIDAAEVEACRKRGSHQWRITLREED